MWGIIGWNEKIAVIFVFIVDSNTTGDTLLAGMGTGLGGKDRLSIPYYLSSRFGVGGMGDRKSQITNYKLQEISKKQIFLAGGGIFGNKCAGGGQSLGDNL